MKTLKIWHAFILIAGIMFVSSSCKKDDNSIKLDFEITVPDDWTYYPLSQGSYVYYASSPLEGSMDSITEDMLISRYNLNGITLDAFYASLIASLGSDTSFHMVYTTDTTINGVASKKFIHLQIFQGINSTIQDTFDIHGRVLKFVLSQNDLGYVVSFHALDSTFNDYKPVFEDIMSTFRFKY
jgi:hypothetical protein